MQIETKLEEMFKLQQRLNDETNGLNWERGSTNQGKPIDWRRAIYIELAELIDSYPWKHWKDIAGRVDYDNIKVELVDIWHFVMSEILRSNKVSKNLDISELAKLIAKEIQNINPKREDNFYKEIEKIEKLLKRLFCDFQEIEFAKEFFELAFTLGLDFDSLYKLYVGKNVLNKFRQDNGYKDGIYIKKWGDREDNSVMQDILSSNTSITPLELYQRLEESYKKVKSKEK